MAISILKSNRRAKKTERKDFGVRLNTGKKIQVKLLKGLLWKNETMIMNKNSSHCRKSTN